MDVRRADLEDLPPLVLRPLRDLDLDAPAGVQGTPRVTSASGVVRRGDVVYVIGDEMTDLARFRISDPEPGRLVRALDPADRRDQAAGEGKPDLEALTVLPPFRGAPFGALLGLGSGSGPRRDRGFAWRLAADGGLVDEPVPIDLAPLYRALSARLDHLNTEGAAVMSGRLWLFNRGDDPEGRNAVTELDLEAVVATVTGDGCLREDAVSAERRYHLGTLDGVPLTFSDATPLGGEMVVFTASAEDRRDGGEVIRGSVIGTLSPDGEVRRLRTIDRRWKVEGVHATVDTGVMDLLMVCDQDDPAVASPLLSAAMPIDAVSDGED